MFANELLRQEQVRLNEARKISVVNVNPTNIRPHSDTPEIRKYKKRFNSEILCAALWGERPVPSRRRPLRLPLSVKVTPTAPLSLSRRQPAGGNGERPHAPGPQRAGEGLQPHHQAPLPADGRAGGAQRAGHHLRWVRGGDDSDIIV